MTTNEPLADMWGFDGRVVQMWAVPVHDDGSCEKAMKSDAKKEGIVDFRGLYGFPQVRTVHIRGTMPDVYQAARERLLGPAPDTAASRIAAQKLNLDYSDLARKLNEQENDDATN